MAYFEKSLFSGGSDLMIDQKKLSIRDNEAYHCLIDHSNTPG